MGFLSKVELKKQLQALGIKVEGNHVRKGDVEKIIASKKTYKIVRFYKEDHPRETIKTGLSLKEAQKHCSDPETNSSTCKKPENVAKTEKMGDWFDGFYEE
jgi:hypothetical protein